MDIEANQGAGLESTVASARTEELDRLELAQDLREARSLRVELSLEGHGSLTLAQTYSEIIAVLRSDEPMPPSLRESIAGALERGQINAPGVRLRIEGPPSYFKALSSKESDDRLLEAGLYIAQQHIKGRPYSAIYNDLPEMFGINDAADFAKRARKIYAELRDFIECNRDEVIVFSVTEELHGYETNMHDYDMFAYARSLFLEARHGFVELDEQETDT